MNDLSNLRRFVRSRPGFYFGNYGDVSAYRSDVRRVGRQLADAETMIRFCELFSAKPDYSAFSGRLEPQENGGFHYCAGQYYCTEYRAAVCACLASGIWQYYRDCGYDAEGIRKAARREFGRGIASRWFN